MIHNILSDAVLCRAGKIVSACFVALLLSGCKDYSFARGTAALPPETPGFLSNLADEYQVLGDYATGQGADSQIAPKFYDKAKRAADGEVVAPEPVEKYKVPAFAAQGLIEARQGLVNALARVNVPENARMLAMAQVKFDCWLAYQPYQKREGGYIGCREAFRQAMANVDFTRELVVAKVKSVSAGPQTVHFINDSMTLSQDAHDKIAALAEQALLSGGVTVMLIGHSKTAATIDDTSNNSVRRIIAVRNALYQNGIDPDAVEVQFDRTGTALDVEIELRPGAV